MTVFRVYLGEVIGETPICGQKGVGLTGIGIEGVVKARKKGRDCGGIAISPTAHPRVGHEGSVPGRQVHLQWKGGRHHTKRRY